MRAPTLRALFLLPMLLAVDASAQRRFDITPLLGYRSPISTTLTDESSGREGKVHIDAGPSTGIAAGVRYADTQVIEFRYTRQNTDTSLSGISGSLAAPGTRLEQFHGDFTHEFPLGHLAKFRPFVMGSVGMTRLSWNGRSDQRFSFGVGGGFKYFPVRWFGIRAQAQWLPIWMNPQIKGMACGSGCTIVVGGKLVDQGEVSFGPVFSF